MNAVVKTYSVRYDALKWFFLRMGWGGSILALLVATLSLKAAAAEGVQLRIPAPAPNRILAAVFNWFRSWLMMSALCNCSFIMACVMTRCDRSCLWVSVYGWSQRNTNLVCTTFDNHTDVLNVCVLAGNCFWVQGLDWCTGTNDGPNGERWAFLAAAMLYCVHSTVRTNEQVFGCGPGVCI